MLAPSNGPRVGAAFFGMLGADARRYSSALLCERPGVPQNTPALYDYENFYRTYGNSI
eukprot:COSAG02_NODE_41046_length_398_cov_2.585284_1_plen_57_part_10